MASASERIPQGSVKKKKVILLQCEVRQQEKDSLKKGWLHNHHSLFPLLSRSWINYSKKEENNQRYV
jgi:hypothetical protein